MANRPRAWMRRASCWASNGFERATFSTQRRSEAKTPWAPHAIAKLARAQVTTTN